MVLTLVKPVGDIFGQWWLIYQFKSKEERFNYYNSLTHIQQAAFRQSFVEGWCDLFCQNQIDSYLDQIESQYGINLIDLRIKAIKFGKIFLIERTLWEEIEHMIFQYEPLFNSDLIFGDLLIKPWGRNKRFVRIAAQRKGTVNA